MKTEKWKISECRCVADIVYEKTGYRLKKLLLEQAFTRKSYNSKYGTRNNEMLELIGDSVLDMYVIKALNQRFGALNSNGEYVLRTSEGEMSVAKSKIVNNETLAKIVDSWGILDYLIVGKCDIDNKIDEQVKPKADLIEAILGAIAIECKWDSTILESVVAKMLSLEKKMEDMLMYDYRCNDFTIENAITTLKELAERGSLTIEEENYAGPEIYGCDENGNAIWDYRYVVTDEKMSVGITVYSSSKKSAKKAAAYLVLSNLFELQNEYGPNGRWGIWEYVGDKLTPKHMSNHYKV